MASETKTKADELLDEILEQTRENAPAEKSETDEETDLDKLKQRTPPREGVCRRCGQDKPVNRMMLCYRCWVLTEIEEREKRAGNHWHAGMTHPDWCQCALSGAHPERHEAGNN